MVNETLKKLYNELIYQLLVEEQVEKIVCNRKSGDNRFFDDLYVDKEKGLVIVHNHGLKMDFDGFCFDFTVDYAALHRLKRQYSLQAVGQRKRRVLSSRSQRRNRTISMTIVIS